MMSPQKLRMWDATSARSAVCRPPPKLLPAPCRAAAPECREVLRGLKVALLEGPVGDTRFGAPLDAPRPVGDTLRSEKCANREGRAAAPRRAHVGVEAPMRPAAAAGTRA